MFMESLGEDRWKESEESFDVAQFERPWCNNMLPCSIPTSTSPLTNKKSKCTLLSGKTDPIAGRKKGSPYRQA